MSITPVDDLPSRPVRILILLLVALLWFSLLGYRDLNEPDEGRYAEIPREMLVSGDWITPRLNGFKYFEKPPLQYWTTAGFYHLFGVGNATSRLWCALMGMVGILAVIRIGTRQFGPLAGWQGGMVLAGMFLYAGLGHFNTLDMGTSILLFLGMGALIQAQSQRDDPGRCRRWMLLGWAALAGATLSKGIIGLVLPGAVVVIYTLWQRDFVLWRHLHLGWGLPLYLVLVAPWFVAVSQANPEFFNFFVIHEHLERYTTAVHGRRAGWWFFPVVLFFGGLPWTGKILLLLFRPGFRWLRGGGGFDPIRLLWVYCVFILFFFSFSHSKLIPYLLPILPPLALLLGRWLATGAEGTEFGLETRILTVVGLLLAGVAISLERLATDLYTIEMVREFRPWLLGALGGMGVGVGLSFRYRCRGSIALTGLTLASLWLVQLLGWGGQAFSPVNSSREAARAVAPLAKAGAPVYCVNCYYHALPFYLDRLILPAIFLGEMEFGIRLEPQGWLPDLVAFNRRWEQRSPNGAQPVAIFRREEFPAWRSQGLPMRILYQDPRRVVVVHP